MLLDMYTGSLNPWREINRLQHDMNELFNRTTGMRSKPTPAINIWANNDGMLLTAELPGLKKKDIKISIKNGELTLEYDRKTDRLDQGEVYHRQERKFGSFKRTFSLPFSVDAEKVDAKIKNGLLTIKLPRPETDKAKQIKIS